MAEASSQPEPTSEQVGQIIVGLASAALQAYKATDDPRIKEIADLCVSKVKQSGGIEELILFASAQQNGPDALQKREESRRKQQEQLQQVMQERMRRRAEMAPQMDSAMLELLEGVKEWLHGQRDSGTTDQGSGPASGVEPGGGENYTFVGGDAV